MPRKIMNVTTEHIVIIEKANLRMMIVTDARCTYDIPIDADVSLSADGDLIFRWTVTETAT